MSLKKIAEYKKQMGLTTEQLSIKSGVPLGTLNKLLSGVTQDPKLETLKALARVFNCPVGDFDDGDTSNDPEPSYERLQILMARHGRPLSAEQKLTLIQILLETEN